MKYYPVYLDLRDRPCLVIGGGVVAERKTLSLLEAGADVTLISPVLTPKLRELSTFGEITHVARKFEDKDVAGEFLVIIATDSLEVNSHVAEICAKKKILVNVAAPPEKSTFIVPSVVERGELLISISTCGASPALAKKIRRELEGKYGPEYGLFLEILRMVRNRLMDESVDEATRRAALLALVDSDVLDLLRAGKTHEAEHRVWELAGKGPG